MNLKRKLLLVIGMMVMTMSSLGLGLNVARAGTSIETSITVLESCVGTPTSLTWSAASYSIPQWAPRGNPGEFLTTPTNTVVLNMNINECVEGWALTGTMTDLASEEGNRISAVNHFVLHVAPNSRAQAVSDTELCMFGTCWYPAIDHLGTSSPVPYGGDIRFAGDGPAYAGQQALLIGDATATGEMSMTWQARLKGIENIAATTPPGAYSGELTVTFTPTAP